MEPAAALVLLCVVLGAIWLLLAGLTVGNRAVYEAGRRAGQRRLALARGSRSERRLLRRASSHRTGAGRWQRIATVRSLAAAHHRRAPSLIRRALVDPDPEMVGAAVRALGDLGGEWAAHTLVEALRADLYSRSRIAAQLDRFAPRIGHLLVPLLADREPPIRFWGATLLAQYPGLGVEALLACSADVDPNVRAAAVETLGRTDDRRALAATLELLGDPVWYVRVHACRAAGELGSVDVAQTIAPLLADEWWWVRNATKDALRGFGVDVAGAIVPYLEHEDRFARNGAAEVLQDVGIVDALVVGDPESPLLARIFAAGGPRLREAARRRAPLAPHRREAAA